MALTPNEKEKARRYRQRHPERHRAAVRKWQLENREKDREAHRRHFHKKAVLGREYLKKIKDVPCKDCGQKYPSYVMDFDHVRGKKRHCVGSLVGQTIKRIAEEIALCDVVCANCHRVRTFMRGVKPRPRTSIG